MADTLESLADLRNAAGAMFRAIATVLDDATFDRLFDEFDRELAMLGVDKGFGHRADEVLRAHGYEIGDVRVQRMTDQKDAQRG